MGIFDVVVFGALAITIILGALKMLNAKEIMHAVVWLALTLTGVAGIFLTLGAEFLAAVQILVYVGAVITLFLFTVMVTTPSSATEGFGEDKTPLSILGIRAPHGWDVEHMEDVPDEPEDEGVPPDMSETMTDDDTEVAVEAEAETEAEDEDVDVADAAENDPERRED